MLNCSVKERNDINIDRLDLKTETEDLVERNDFSITTD